MVFKWLTLLGFQVPTSLMEDDESKCRDFNSNLHPIFALYRFETQCLLYFLL